MKNNQGGFIALISVIIISFVLLSTTLSLNSTGFFGRFNIFDSESKMKSDVLAEACLAQARLILANNKNFTGNGNLTVETNNCKYEILNGGKIKAWAEVNKTNTYYWAEVDQNTPEILIKYFKECKTLSPCP